MVNYQNGKIYSIRSVSRPDLIYIGSTTQTLARRIYAHRQNHICYKNSGKTNYVTSYQILDIGDEYIELLEDYPCDNKNQLHKREGELIRANECVNKYIPGRTKKQYREDNKEAIKQYRENNKEALNQWRENNKEHLITQMKQYYENNKETIRIYNKQRIPCSYCDYTFTQSNKARHIKSKTHIKNFKQAYLDCWGEPFTGVLTNQDY